MHSSPSAEGRPAPERRRSFARGFIAGLLVHVLLGLAFAFLLAQATKAAASAFGVVNPLSVGPFEPLSYGWLATQAGRIAIGIVAGATAAHWGRPFTWSAPAALAVLSGALGTLSVPSVPAFIAVPWLLLDGASILLGAWLYFRRTTNDA